MEKKERLKAKRKHRETSGSKDVHKDEKGSWDKVCKKCGNHFIAMRSNAIFCSGSCKVLFSMTRTAMLQIARAMPEKTLKECKLKLGAYNVALS